MKSKWFLMGILDILLVFGATLTSCATYSSIGGTSDPHGLISIANVVSAGSEVIASYSVILGLLDAGYESYAATVKQAESAGKTVSSVTTEYFGWFTKVTAYAK
ncbi:MAG: hypothetical protein LBJ41_00335 [Treponema sp.]|nr:hypothetical protein [Treponema sp.]